MDYEPIKKSKTDSMSIAPNLLDYRRARESFTWDSIYKELDGLDGKGEKGTRKQRLGTKYRPFHLRPLTIP